MNWGQAEIGIVSQPELWRDYDHRLGWVWGGCTEGRGEAEPIVKLKSQLGQVCSRTLHVIMEDFDYPDWKYQNHSRAILWDLVRKHCTELSNVRTFRVSTLLCLPPGHRRFLKLNFLPLSPWICLRQVRWRAQWFVLAGSYQCEAAASDGCVFLMSLILMFLVLSAFWGATVH